jgi:hypothetical protein
MSRGRLSQRNYQVLVTAGVFFGLFFIEYPPLFQLGYWAWPYTVGYTLHKILSGLFIILNLGITQYAVRRWGYFKRAPSAETDGVKTIQPQTDLASAGSR